MNVDKPHSWSLISRKELEEFIASREGLLAVSSHQIRPPMPSRVDWKIFPVVFLRHPIDRAGSVFLFEKKMRAIPQDLSLADYIRWQLGPEGSTVLRNFHVACLSSATLEQGPVRRPVLELRHFAQAKAFIESLSSFGLVERFDDSLTLLGHALQPHFPQLSLRSVRENISPGRPSSLSSRLKEIESELGAELYAEYMEANRLDLEFYDFASHLFEQHFRAMKTPKETSGKLRFFSSKKSQRIAELEGEVDKLQRENKHLQKKLDKAKPSEFMPAGHFYSPIPGKEEVEAAIAAEDKDDPMAGIDLRESEQLELLSRLARLYPEIPFSSEKDGKHRYSFANPAYSWCDGIMLYSMIRELQPKRIVEIGSGYSSCLTLDTNELFFGGGIECTFIEPHAQLLRSLLRPGEAERVQIIEKKLQDVDLGIFEKLQAHDILFVDSSHVMKAGSDLHTLFFQILPRLKAGVVIHFHDVFDRFEYPAPWLREGRAWNEDYVLRAFLQGNSEFKIKMFTSYMLRAHRDWFEKHMPNCLRNLGGNLWIERVFA